MKQLRRRNGDVIAEYDGPIRKAVENNRANLFGAELGGAELGGAYLAGADLAGAYLRGANLAEADLAGAYLAEAYLGGAYLAGADLFGAYLFGANLFGADLAGARLNWLSHDLIAELLRRAAADDVEKRKIAGLVLISRDWCWKDFRRKGTPEELAWAREVLSQWEGCPLEVGDE